jgi:hypothetical protein
MPRHATERTLSANALNKRSAKAESKSLEVYRGLAGR